MGEREGGGTREEVGEREGRGRERVMVSALVIGRRGRGNDSRAHKHFSCCLHMYRLRSISVALYS